MKQLTRVCSSCKIEKPLTAFLEIHATKGTTYGSLCSSCRSKETRNKIKPGEEEYSRLSSGLRIGAKEKTFADKEHLRIKKNLEGLQEIDLKKKEDKIQEKLEKTRQKEESKKFLSDTQKTLLTTFPPKQTHTNQAPNITATEREQAMREHLSEKEFVKKEIRKSVTNFNRTMQGRAELDSPIVQSYLAWLGDKAPLTQLLKRGFSRLTASDQKTSENKQTDAQKEQDLSSLAKNNWGKKK